MRRVELSTMKSYSYLKGGELPGSMRIVEVVESRLKEVVSAALINVVVDEEYYRRTNSDVDAEIRAGKLDSARDHYILSGYFEDRLPRLLTVDEAWYIGQYPDVADAIKKGAFLSAAQHFDVSGFKEGRLPSAGWSL